MELVSLLFAGVVGFTHAFEADHLVAVSSIVTRRNNLQTAVKDGIYWGLGHTSTILLVGGVFLLGRFAVREEAFRYLEAGVGGMLIMLGGFRLNSLVQGAKPQVHAHNGHTHAHKLAYGVGLVHGLAGSGALILSVLTTINGTLGGLIYLTIFGVGSIAGMMLAAGLFSVPLSGRIIRHPSVRMGITLVSALLCIGLGLFVIVEHLS
ncbi:urease accessory protein [Arsenicibacter rosenii]|uniref:Urease accessory protein n=1 Tax=Arsenicibacter rosenii TaxID=1750698 RepID=A0A1S2VM08_9BACT|nr:urease accessory protein [Arsenicibacter rosenii]OIN59430.1 urease accessory protein [Arsenicibacter rosenii]